MLYGACSEQSEDVPKLAITYRLRRPELKLRAHSLRVLRTLEDSPKVSLKNDPMGGPSGISHKPDHSWSGDKGTANSMLRYRSWGLPRSEASVFARNNTNPRDKAIRH